MPCEVFVMTLYTAYFWQMIYIMQDLIPNLEPLIVKYITFC